MEPDTGSNGRGSVAGAGVPADPLWLLVRVSLLQARRRVVAVREQSRLLSSMIGLFVLGYLLVSFLIFRKGLMFISTFPGLGLVLIERLLYLLFALLFVLLLFSNLVISYTNLFRNRETQFLMTLPVPARTVFRWKLIESSVLASWAFLFLIAPLLMAYGLTQQVAWHFYVFTPVLIGVFIVLPAVAGAWCSVHLAWHMDRRLFQIVVVGAGMVFLALAVPGFQPEVVTDEMLETRVLAVLDRLLDQTRFALNPLLPSYWLSTSVLQWAEHAYRAAGFFALVLLSHALFFSHCAFQWMGGPLSEAASAVESRGSVLSRWGWFRAWQGRRTRAMLRRGWIEDALRIVPGLGGDVRALLAKDIRVFWRDTTQWGQTLVLFGLLGAYIMNLRHFSQQLTNPYWIHLVSFLNLGACSLNLATLTTRFVFPQFSLEGKRLWIVGMAPLGLPQVVRAKFGLASGASLLVTLNLILLSCAMLKLSWDRTLYSVAAIVIMTFTLNGLAVGLGVLYPNFKEDNPSKIVSGFGGTFCLVSSFLYIVCSIVLLAFGSPWTQNMFRAPGWMMASWIAFALLSLALGWLPMKLAFRRLKTIEI